MAAYPMTKVSRASRVVPDAGIKAKVAEDGTVMFRRDRGDTAYQLQIVHEFITAAERTTLRDFFTANGYGPHTVTGLKGDTYTATFLNDPTDVDHKGSLYVVETQAIGVRV